MTHRLLCVVLLLIIAGVLPVYGQEFPPQQVHRGDFEAVSDELFSVAKMFYEYDKSYPLNAVVVETEQDSTGTYEKITITASNDERIPIEISIPAVEEKPPIVVLIHGLGSSKERWARPDRIALTSNLLESGYAVAALDLQYHGERSVYNDFQNPVFLTFGDSLFVRSKRMLIQSTIDVMRAIDYLENRSDITLGNLVLVGYSMGAMIASFVPSLDDRITTSVVCAIPTRNQPIMLDPYHFASRSTIPAKVIAGSSDWLSSPADLEMLVDILPAGSSLTLIDAGHTLPPEFTLHAFQWINSIFQRDR